MNAKREAQTSDGSSRTGARALRVEEEVGESHRRPARDHPAASTSRCSRAGTCCSKATSASARRRCCARSRARRRRVRARRRHGRPDAAAISSITRTSMRTASRASSPARCCAWRAAVTFFFNEINRARPQVQSLLLRAMAERTVSAFNRQYRFPA